MYIVGLAFRCQLFNKVPADGRDARMDFIMTASQTIDCSSSIGQDFTTLSTENELSKEV